ncbi:hypothetical protein MTO96_048198 [Rhipicephalus appendiculatus]
MSDISEQVGGKAATSDALSSSQATVKAPSKAAAATAVTTEEPSAPKAAAAVASETPQRSDVRPHQRKKRPSIASQMCQSSRSSRSKRKQRKQKPDDDQKSQRLREARRLDVNYAHGRSGGVGSPSSAGPLSDGAAVYDGNTVHAVSLAHPMAPS